MNVNFFAVLKESPTLVVLILCSIISIMFIIERWWYLRKCKVNSTQFMEKMENFIDKGSISEASTFCDKHPTPLSNVVKTGLTHHKKNKEQVSELMEARKMEERLGMEKWLGILGTLGNTAPFIGLLGTVVGIIKAFDDLAKSGTGGPTIVARGIAEALVATAAGLLVAIPSVMAFNYFQRKIKTMITDIDVAMKKILVYMDK